MKARFEILRQSGPEAQPWTQIIDYVTDNENATVATALADMNRTPGLKDVEGKPVGHIHWECSCLQKKCGACAMRIGGVPGLACDKKLKDVKGDAVKLEPLKKFPVVADLIVDRSALYENLKDLRAWLDREVQLTEPQTDVAYEASRCLQCGCCLEVCPNFMPGERFAGTAAMAPLSRLIEALPRERKSELYRAYGKRFYNGCGKSLACRDICPAGLDVEKLLVNSNAIAVWKRFFNK